MSQNDIDSLIDSFNNSDKNLENMIDELDKISSLNKKPEIKNEHAAFASKDHMVIDRLDEINKENEEKVNKLFEYLESAAEELDKTEKFIKDIKPYVEKHKEFMDFFAEHFDKTIVRDNYEYFNNIINITNNLEQSVSKIKNNIFDAMDILQFQDITRQKIERVISVIKALRDYLNTWFDSSNYDEKPRARVAHTIADEQQKKKIDYEVENIVKQMQEKGER